MAGMGIIRGIVGGVTVNVAPYLSQQPVDDFSLNFTGLKYSATLAVSTDTSVTIPDLAPRYKALIKCQSGSNVWVALNQPAVVPVGASLAISSSELVPADGVCRDVRSGDVLHFISAVAASVSVVLYSMSTNN